jgi:hypothetical protein
VLERDLSSVEKPTVPAQLLALVRLAAWTCVAAIAVLSLIPSGHIERTDLSGHTEHVLAYAGTALLLLIGYQRLNLLVMLVTYSGVLEYLQRFAPGRTSQLGDLAFSCLGIILGAAAGWAIISVLSRLAMARSPN